MELYILINNESRGPYTENVIREMIRNGEVTQETLGYDNGSGQWRPVGTLLQTNAMAASLPAFPVPPSVLEGQSGAEFAGSVFEKIGTGVSKIAGLNKTEKFNLKIFFSEVFKKHSQAEAEEILAVGTLWTTPSLKLLNLAPPKPWLYTRVFLLLLVSTFVLWMLVFGHGVTTGVPGLLFISATIIPFSVLIFAFELNQPQNVSFYVALKLFLLGGVLSLIATMYLIPILTPSIAGIFGMDWGDAKIAAFVEEPAKALILLMVAFNKRYPFTLNGFIFGVAIGTGFAIIESAGYILNYSTDKETLYNMIVLRNLDGIMSHGLWTGIIGAALWRVKAAAALSFKHIVDIRFLRIAIFPVAMHALGNAGIALPPIFAGNAWGVSFINLVVGGALVFILLQDGREQLRAVQSNLH